MSSPNFDLIIPCYCPREGWAKNLCMSVEKLNSALPHFSIQKLIIVDDGSMEKISEAEKNELQSEQWDLCVIEHKINLGKGAAVRTGLAKSQSEFAMFTDVDVPYLVADMAKMLELISRESWDIALGIRGQSYYDSLSPFRKLVSRSLLFLNKKMFALPIGDTQGGLKAMNRRGREIVLNTTINRYLFDLEMVQLAVKNSLAITGVEVRLQQNIQLPGLGLKTLLQESRNFLTLILSR